MYINSSVMRSNYECFDLLLLRFFLSKPLVVLIRLLLGAYFFMYFLSLRFCFFSFNIHSGTSLTEANKNFYKDDILGVAYAINDDFAISYNIIESVKHAHNAGTTIEQETKAINVAYTVGGLTLGLQDAKTDNAGWASGTNDDTRTISIKTAF